MRQKRLIHTTRQQRRGDTSRRPPWSPWIPHPRPPAQCQNHAQLIPNELNMTTLIPRPVATENPAIKTARFLEDKTDRESEIRAAENRKSQSPSLVMLVVIATLGIFTYAAFLLNPASRGDWLPYTMVIAAESLLIAQALLSMWTI